MPQPRLPRQPLNLPTSGVCHSCGHRCFDRSSTVASASSGTDRSGISTPDSERHYSHLDLLEQVFSTCYADAGPRVAQARELASMLGLGEPGSYPGFRWQVVAHASTDLTPKKFRLPDKHEHSGKFAWVGREKNDLPKYLWDNQDDQTVKATPERLRKYCAVSWTWGRYQKGYAERKPEWRDMNGVEWRVPKLPQVKSHFLRQTVDRLTHLKHLLKSIKTFRYFWVDVLCINQNEDEDAQAEKKIEIAKQAQIFSNARASIAFMWGLDERNRHDLSRALGALGGLLASCIWFRPGQPYLGASSANSGGIFPQHSEWDGLFARLQGDRWFTSLWALQEMVLSPATIWMTQDGGIATVNQRPVTTRLFASAVRLLQKMSEIRNQQWLLEEKSFLRRHRINESHYFNFRKALDDLEHRRRMALQEERRRQDERSDEAALCLEVSTELKIPNVLRHWREDQPLQDEVDKWIKWSFGQAGIDVCLGASRTAILIAGSNRLVVDNQSKEYALLAALKIGYDKELLAGKFPDFLECDKHHFSHKLLNVVLREEGPRMFNVLHETFVPEFKTNSLNLLDVSEWESLPATFSYLEIALPDKPKMQRQDSDNDGDWVKITEKLGLLQRQAKYHHKRARRDRYVAIPREQDRILTDMSPWKAAYTNYKDPSREGSSNMLPEDINEWHFHPSGKVHIPPSAKIQDLSTTSTGTKLKLRLNGGDVDGEYDISSTSDLQDVWRTTQTWLYKKLGKPKFLFLPLYTYQAASRDSNRRDRERVVDNHEKRVGIVLVGRAHLRKEQSHTIWYKLGTYQGTGPTTPLGWKDGIIVTSPHEEAQVSSKQIRSSECQELKGVATLFKQTSSDMAAMVVEEDPEGLHLSKIQRVQSRESVGSDQTANDGYRFHFVRYFGWLFGGTF